MKAKKTLDEANLQISNLTLTEKKILKLVASNKTSKEIAEELFVSYRTIENHRSNICKKLNLSGGNALLRFALENKSKF
ncbi:MAG TPA: LuxR C-terminal-related transcriptional regulator [Ignavibacteriaceae bacterium]|nr:LuxR C-terminal-related transcriptional regulator [Ignavibacteriaceae bacterium]